MGKSNPWQVEALKVITGSEEEAHKPLSTILKTHFDLTLDKNIDISGWSKAGHVLDTQGYIAHNDEIIVLAYRCTTSGLDWLTNMSTTTSAWELEEDIAQGHSGFLSCLSGHCCVEDYKPRVHTGFYNNFLVTAPMIQEYIDPLLGPDQPPRKFYVVGHSLGGGIAIMAACYFLTEFDWTQLPQKLVVVTAGGPRSVQKSMKVLIDEEMKKLRPLDKAVICRIVRDKDVVPKVPPAIFGFHHLEKLVYITKEGELLINPDLGEKQTFNKEDLENLMMDNTGTPENEGENEEDGSVPMSSYEKKVNMVPRALRDHMPDFYLKPLLHVLEEETGMAKETPVGKDGDETASESDLSGEEEHITVTTERNRTKSNRSESHHTNRAFGSRFRLFSGCRKGADEAVVVS